MRNSARLSHRLIVVFCFFIFSPHLHASLPDGFCQNDNSQILFTCALGNGDACPNDLMNNIEDYKQILILPIGYQDPEEFADEAEGFRFNAYATGVPPEKSRDIPWSYYHAENVLHLTFWISGGDINTSEATFSAKTVDNIFSLGVDRLALNQLELREQVGMLQWQCAGLNPFSVVALFNGDSLNGSETPNASPPTSTGDPYGVTFIAGEPLNENARGRTASHELGHSAMGWTDEYILKSGNVRDLDVLTPLIIFDQGPLEVLLSETGMYPMEFSEILFANGADNVSLVPYPARVTEEGVLGSEAFEKEGAFFSRGIYRLLEFKRDANGELELEADAEGNMVPIEHGNLMSSSLGPLPPSHSLSSLVSKAIPHEPGTPFYLPSVGHSASQQRVVDFVMEQGPARANDRIVNAGPPSGFSLAYGNQWRVMLFDEDKNHAFHPTQRYDVQVQWWETAIRQCKMKKWPYWTYLCFKRELQTVEKSFAAAREELHLERNFLWQLGGSYADLLCNSGFERLIFVLDENLCTAQGLDPIKDALPFARIMLPYQNIHIPTPLFFTKYQWRFRTYNGHVTSGWTNWSELGRTL